MASSPVQIPPLPTNPADLLKDGGPTLWRILDALRRAANWPSSTGPRKSVTIDTGVIIYTAAHLEVDTEAAAASDDLDTITGGSDGDLLLLRNVDAARVVVVKDGTGNIALGADRSLDDPSDTLLLSYDGTLAQWGEVGFANNA